MITLLLRHLKTRLSAEVAPACNVIIAREPNTAEHHSHFIIWASTPR